jgi:23S rRNA-/tRNA-specific pseudouridylate synthase
VVPGFLHPIRASFAHLGHPVVGDRRYGPLENPLGAPRLMLHAARLALEGVRAESPDPPEFAELLARLRRSGAGVVA